MLRICASEKCLASTLGSLDTKAWFMACGQALYTCLVSEQFYWITSSLGNDQRNSLFTNLCKCRSAEGGCWHGDLYPLLESVYNPVRKLSSRGHLASLQGLCFQAAVLNLGSSETLITLFWSFILGFSSHQQFYVAVSTTLGDATSILRISHHHHLPHLRVRKTLCQTLCEGLRVYHLLGRLSTAAPTGKEFSKRRFVCYSDLARPRGSDFNRHVPKAMSPWSQELWLRADIPEPSI